jgi:hypothetical protein
MVRLAHGALAFALLVGAGCGGDDDPASSDTGTSQPTESVATTAVPTAEASDAEAVVFTVTQTDSGCTISGPDTVPADETYFVVVEDPHGRIPGPLRLPARRREHLPGLRGFVRAVVLEEV